MSKKTQKKAPTTQNLREAFRELYVESDRLEKLLERATHVLEVDDYVRYSRNVAIMMQIGQVARMEKRLTILRRSIEFGVNEMRL